MSVKWVSCVAVPELIHTSLKQLAPDSRSIINKEKKKFDQLEVDFKDKKMKHELRFSHFIVFLSVGHDEAQLLSAS